MTYLLFTNWHYYIFDTKDMQYNKGKLLKCH